MLIQRFEEKGLAHYSYAVGCEEKGQIAIIDPRRDVDIYLEYAEKQRSVISHVIETHIHGDYASGARELAKRARASLYLSAYDKGETYEVSFPHKECKDGDILRVGPILLKVLHTPGHTPEHIALLLYTDEGPQALFSGDFLLIGTIGRSDLFGKKEALKLAHEQFQSARSKLKGLPDHIQIFPAHGAGAFYDVGTGGHDSSTLGAEKHTNPFLKPELTEEDFIKADLMRDLPIPPYFSRMKAFNSSGKHFETPSLKPYDIETFKKVHDREATIIDLRDQKAFAEGHIPGSICIGASAKVGFWASWVVSYEKPILFVTDNPVHLEEVIFSLSRVGLDRVTGFLKGGYEAWKRSGLPTSQMAEYSTEEIDNSALLIDVRTNAEWEMGHLPGALHIPCYDIPRKLGSLPEKRLVFICAGGYRSIFAASYAKQAGHNLVGHVPGGMHACQLQLTDV